MELPCTASGIPQPAVRWVGEDGSEVGTIMVMMVVMMVVVVVVTMMVARWVGEDGSEVGTADHC